MIPFAVCLQFKDEEQYIKEWFNYHYRVLKADKFILINNRTTDRTLEILKPHIDSGLIDIIDWPGETKQHTAYAKVLTKYRKLIQWIAFIDTDEFIFSPSGSSIHNLLENNKEYACLELEWMLFGSDGHLFKTPGLVTERFTKCGQSRYKGDRHFGFAKIGDPMPIVKCIVQPIKCNRAISAHKFVTKNIKRIPKEQWRINHYAVKSREEFHWKMHIRTRGEGYKPITDEAYFNKFDINEYTDTSMLKYKEILKCPCHLPNTAS